MLRPLTCPSLLRSTSRRFVGSKVTFCAHTPGSDHLFEIECADADPELGFIGRATCARHCRLASEPGQVVFNRFYGVSICGGIALEQHQRSIFMKASATHAGSNLAIDGYDCDLPSIEPHIACETFTLPVSRSVYC
ncbi:hypothetical protein E5Q_02013 [Mixia osmundae IAM 14324]|uniref:Uncharacterized protein n=1 Tax=Mixia osmundae (strain CBS 9802 / IAM 14324 / JCM 22182 / KY 12970) TaxID=764103 RepID=G7DXP6_MIXOS|nr:hypothetical protein E5Q_02013 [Mixia osmundae IAM 14324]